jgi:hypothetical protein
MANKEALTNGARGAQFWKSSSWAKHLPAENSRQPLRGAQMQLHDRA